MAHSWPFTHGGDGDGVTGTQFWPLVHGGTVGRGADGGVVVGLGPRVVAVELLGVAVELGPRVLAVELLGVAVELGLGAYWVADTVENPEVVVVEPGE